ncbi:tripartite tricarboxylate transporter TctB family protein [Ancylobacter sp. A5.8]|uniref:tripartite tricarboxylate transporter TctB family protein n=1 Tax=Ancylobacter gelatini TaxID=2919920 RepID=UPI001F4DB6DE|nr:tripartite tricarboxylate transporter TctB family protein [Ancylobacter gelatini]MCJ8142011.1 tripartite tricarboxylate transporter TctB family protein [Ancylobacter gelatini]
MFKDIICGCVLLALSVGYYLTATAFPKSALDTSVSASAFPEMIGVIGAFFSVLLIAQGVWSASARRARPASAGAEATDDDALTDWPRHKAALGLLVIMCGFLLLLEPLGYPVALASLIFVVAIYLGMPIGLKTASVAIGGALFFWLFFVQFLGIHMPMGILEHLGALDVVSWPVHAA